ncbi:GNAT family acetyltransferase [Demequina sp. TTPB684]|uniref:GNAT family acetyltransferase n=1 Tax=Demequina sp. TMPB413 TaxID=2881056 RepID=UPI001CF19DD2|nr:GNAT family acetyltransferase [Demequina sp. TMPB413]MCB2413305.1 GNAT family acetyltransferase [Demequina sp. TTPB684]
MALIRPFSSVDEAAVSALWAQAFPGDPARNEPRGFIARKRTRDSDLFWVAEADGEVVGAVVAGYDGVRGWLYHLAVAPGLQGRGIGRALAEHAVAALRELGCMKVNLQVRRGNDAVRGFYESLGWVEDPAISMGRVLSDSP